MWNALSLWIGSIFFFIAILLLKANDPKWSNLELFILLLDVLIGIISWAYFAKFLKELLHKKYSKQKANLLSYSSILLSSIGGVIIIIALLILLIGYSSPKQQQQEVKVANYKLINAGLKIGSSGEEVKLLQAVLSTDSSIYPSKVVSGYYGTLTKDAINNFQAKYNLAQIGEIDETTANKFNEIYGNNSKEYYLANNPTAIPQVNNIQNTNNQYDSDPVINCNVHINCGGGTRQLKQSICNQSTCCQVGNTWLFYENKDKCHQDQNNYNNQNRNYTAPTFAPLPSYNRNNTKIKCSYSNGEYQFDFGELTSEECTIKSNEYWAQKRQEINSSRNNNDVYSNTSNNKTQEQIEQCKRNVINNGYDDRSIEINCSVQFGDSSANEACITIKKQERDRLINNCGS